MAGRTKVTVSASILTKHIADSEVLNEVSVFKTIFAADKQAGLSIDSDVYHSVI